MVRALLMHRVTFTCILIVILVLAWNSYILAHDDGLLVGYVIDCDGRPVEAAKVVISALSQINRNVIAVTETGEGGRFSFQDHDSHAMYIEAEKESVGSSRRREVRLYFRNQNHTLDGPLVLEPEIERGLELAPVEE